MRIEPKYIPLIIVTAFLVVYLIPIQTLTTINFLGLDSFYISIGTISLAWLFVILKKDIWVYIFTIFLVISFLGYLTYKPFSIGLSVNSFFIDIITLALLGVHYFTNIDSFKLQTSEDIVEDRTRKVDFFIKQYSSKTEGELLDLKNEDLVPEAKEAIDNLLQHK